MDDVAPHLSEYRVQGVEQRLLRADHKGQRTRLSATGAARHRRIGHVHTLFGRCGCHIARGLRVDGAAIHCRNTLAYPRQNALVAQPYAAHMRGCRQHGDHQFSTLRRCTR